MKERLYRFFMGRNGFDSLAGLSVALALVMLVASRLLGAAAGGVPSLILWALSLAALIYAYWRVLSRNVVKRRAENDRFLRWTAPLRSGVRGWMERFRQRKLYKFYKCPSCRTLLRVPKGKGKLQITCRKCGSRFVRKT